MFENIKTSLKSNSIVSLVAASLLISLLLTFPILKNTLMFQPIIKDFSEHIMSSATSENVNVATRIKFYYSIFFGVICLFFACFFSLLIFFEKKLNSSKDYFIYIKNLSFIGIFGVISSILSANQDYSVFFIGGIVLLSLLFFKYDNLNFDISMILWSSLLAIPITLFIRVILLKFNLVEFISNKLYLDITEIVYFVVIWFLVSIFNYIISGAIIKFFYQKFNITIIDSKAIIIKASVPVLLTGVAQSILLEIMNILNKRLDIVFGRPTLIYCIIFIASVLIMFLIIGKLINKGNNCNSDLIKIINKIYIPIILATFSLIIAQPAKVANVGGEFFEMANHGLSVDHLFKYGSLPLIETFDAHLLSNQIFAYIYSLLNGYEPWAAFLYDQFIQVIYIFVLYYILKSLIGEVNSLFFIISFPLLDHLFNMYFVLSAILVFFLYRCIRKEGTQTSVQFWLVGASLCLYRLDLGVAALLAGILTYLITFYINNKKYSMVKFFGIGVSIGGLSLLLFVILCLIKGISPVNRLIELIKLCLSNQNWAYPSVGDNDSIVYSLCYFVFPLLIIILIIKYFLIDKNSIKINHKNLSMFLFFSLFYLINLPRGIVRHSLVEGAATTILGTFSLSVLIYVVMISYEKRKVINFLIASIIVVILTNTNFLSFHGSFSVVTKALSSVNYSDQYLNVQPFKGTRVVGDLPTDAKDLKEIIESTLNKEETYFDFSSSNYLYALVGRKNPIYANQSPLMLSGDKTQELALKELKSKKPALILMPIFGKQLSNIDGIAVDYKYYKISEYIYDKYTPLIRLSNFDIYCLKENKDTYVERLKKQGLIQNKLYSGSFRNFNTKKIIKNNVVIDKNGERDLVIKSQGEDPYVIGILSELKDRSPEFSEVYDTDKPTKIVIKFRSSNVGNLQLFYIMKEGEGFSENQSMSYSTSGDGEESLILELPSAPYEIRLDPNISDITLTSIEIDQGLIILNGQPEAWVREIGDIPLLWAEKGGAEQFKNASYLPNLLSNSSNFNIDARNLEHAQATFLYLQIKSETDQKSYIELFSKDQSQLGEFIFNISKGTHDYAIRLSTDYKWWAGEANYLSLKTDNVITLNKVYYYLENQSKYLDVLLK